MDPPFSRSRMDRLGKRLALDEPLSVEDRGQFQAILEFYQELLDEAARVLTTIGYQWTSRVKTTGTLREKLQREHGIQLTRINDIAGLRIVVDGGLVEQDEARDAIVNEFSRDASRDPQVIDRRLDPRSGYRAVHVVVYLYGYPVEIQIRTKIQDSWAQIFERTADRWGRQIRYGGEADDPDRTVHIRGEILKDKVPRRKVLELLQSLSNAIHIYEQRRREDVLVTAARAEFETELMPSLEDLAARGADLSIRDDAEYHRRRSGLISACKLAIADKRRRNRIVRRSFPANRANYKPVPWLRGVQAAMAAAEGAYAASRPDRLQKSRLLAQALEDLSRVEDEEDRHE